MNWLTMINTKLCTEYIWKFLFGIGWRELNVKITLKISEFLLSAHQQPAKNHRDLKQIPHSLVPTDVLFIKSYNNWP